MLKTGLLTGLLSTLCCVIPPCQADDGIEANGSVLIDGDKLELLLDRKMRAIGHASMSRGKQSVSGDVIDYDLQNDELHVTGNVQITLDNAQIQGSELRLQLANSLGEFKNASFKMLKNAPVAPANLSPTTVDDGDKSTLDYPSKPLSSATDVLGSLYLSTTFSARKLTSQGRGDAKSVLFEGQDVKRFKEARYTTCAADVDDWYIKADELKLNNYTESGSAKNAYLEIKGVNVLYTPWLNFSYNDQRKSGLLAPTYGTTSNSGVEIAVPYYWNIAPNKDATITSRVLSRRGVQLQGEFRYLAENFSGMDNLEYLADDKQTDQSRYYLNLKHQHQFEQGWSAGYRFEKVSDDQYFADLSTLITSTSRVNLPQQLNVDYVDDTWRFNALAQQFQTLDQSSYPYQRLPQLSLIGEKFYGQLYASMASELVSFNRNHNAPVAATGTRATLYPSLSLPMTQAYGYLTPKLGLHHTSYSLDNDPNGHNSYHRSLPIASLDSGLFFDRDFKIADRAYTQTIEPRLFYLYIPNVNQADMPVFDTSQSDLNFSSLFSENQFNGNDRINNANQLSLSLTARLIETDSGTQRLSATVGQRYYFNEQKVALDYSDSSAYRSSNSSDILAGLSTNLKTHWNVDAFWQYNTDQDKFVSTNVTSRFTPEPGKALNLSYSYRQDSIEQVDLSGQWPLGRGWYGIARVNYSLLDKQVVETLAGLEYDAGCWQTRTVMHKISTATSGDVYALFFQVELGGIASIGINPMQVIERSIPGYMHSGRIPETYKQPYYE